MRTRHIPSLFASCVCLGFTLPDVCGEAPRKIKSLTIALTGEKATYKDDLDTLRVRLGNSDLNGEPFSYTRKSDRVGKLKFTNWMKSDSGTYSGSFTLTFTSDSEGSFRENYTGTYTGFVEGTFKILAMDVPIPPVAERQTLKIREGRKTSLRLKGEGFDIRKSDLKYKIVKPPKVGKLITGKGSKMTYKPKPGFTGTDKFKFIVKEGKTKSKPATVTIKVR